MTLGSKITVTIPLLIGPQHEKTCLRGLRCCVCLAPNFGHTHLATNDRLVLYLLGLCARLFICALWSPAGIGLSSWLSFVVSYCELSLSHWYPGSGVVLDCINPDLCTLTYFENNKGVDQPGHPLRLISAFVICFLESIISKLATGEISILSS